MFRNSELWFGDMTLLDLPARLRPLPALKAVARRVLHARGWQSRWVDSELGRLHVYDAIGRGTMPPFVVLHGISSEALTFAPFLQRLQASASRVIAPDMPGHGRSEPPRRPLDPETFLTTMSDVLDELIDEPAVLMGNSLGGALALRYAASRPKKVKALVLCSPAAARMSEAELDEVRRTFDLRSRSDAMVFFRKLYHRMPWFAHLFARDYVDVVSGAAVRDLLRTATVDDLAKPEHLAELTMPTLLIWGRSERILPASGLGFFRQHMPPNVLIEEPYGFGHCPHLDNPRRLAERVVHFVEHLTHTHSSGKSDARSM